jgi:hypothetical protein
MRIAYFTTSLFQRLADLRLDEGGIGPKHYLLT